MFPAKLSWAFVSVLPGCNHAAAAPSAGAPAGDICRHTCSCRPRDAGRAHGAGVQPYGARLPVPAPAWRLPDVQGPGKVLGPGAAALHITGMQ